MRQSRNGVVTDVIFSLHCFMHVWLSSAVIP